MTEILAILAAIAVFGFIRIEIIYRIRMRAIDLIGEENVRRIHAGEKFLLKYLTEREADGISQTYNTMFFDLTKWKLKQFYPDIPERR